MPMKRLKIVTLTALCLIGGYGLIGIMMSAVRKPRD